VPRLRTRHRQPADDEDWADIDQLELDAPIYKHYGTGETDIDWTISATCLIGLDVGEEIQQLADVPTYFYAEAGAAISRASLLIERIGARPRE